MNTRLKMALLMHYGESGFAIVIAVSLGLIMILVGLTMTLRSQGDQIVASTQKSTEQALGAAEKGVTYYQAFLNSNRRLSAYPDCRAARTTPGQTCTDPASTTDTTQMSWSNVSNVPGITSACNQITNTNDIQNVYASTAWKLVDPNDSSKGQYRLVSYQVLPPDDYTLMNKGRLTIEGRMANTTNNNAPNKAISQVQVDIPIKLPDVQNIPIPGVWIGGTGDTDATGGNTVKANILVNNCNLTAAQMASLQANIVGTNNSIQKTDLAMPNVPTMPALRVINTPPTPNVPGTIPMGTISTNTTLPRPEDSGLQVTFNGQANTYVYSVDTISPNTTLTITKGQKVVIFLSGSISQNVEIIHCGEDNTCNPLNFKIFGTATTGSPEICLNGNRRIEAFILAPNYTVGVMGGGNLRDSSNNPIGNIKGAVWAKEWGNGGGCGSNSNNLVVEQQGSWSDLTGLTPKYLPPPLGPINVWQRKNVN